MSHLLSFLALYGWPQPLDFSKCPDALVSLVEDAKIVPTKATFFVPEEKKERRRTLFKKRTLNDVLAQFPSYEWVALGRTDRWRFQERSFTFAFPCDQE